MAIYRDLNEPLEDWLGKRLSERATQTSPTGIKDLGSAGDVVWTEPDGATKSVKDMAAEVADLLEQGLKTEHNTVSTNPPSSIEGFHDGEWWTQIQAQDDTTVVGLWKMVAGEWVAQSIPAGGLIAPYADIGLLSVAMLSAKIITSGFLRTAASGQRVEIDEDGLRAYNADGAETLNFDGADNTLQLGSATPGKTGLVVEKEPGLDGFGLPNYGLYFTPTASGRGRPALRVSDKNLRLEGGGGSRLALDQSGYNILWAETANNINSGQTFRVYIGSDTTGDGDNRKFYASSNTAYMRAGVQKAQFNAGANSDGTSYANMSATNSTATGARVWVEGERAGMRASDNYGGHYIQVDERGLVIDGYRWTRETVTSTATYPTLSDFPNGRFNIQIPYPGHGGLPTPNWGLLDVERVPAAGGGTNYFATYRDDLATGYWTRTYVNGTWTPWRNLSGASGIAWSVTVPGGWINDTNRQFERSGGSVHINIIVRPTGVAPVGEHWVSTFGSEVTALGAGKPRNVGSWISIGNNPRGGSCTLDFATGRVYIHTLQDIPANENLQLTFNFTTTTK